MLALWNINLQLNNQVVLSFYMYWLAGVRRIYIYIYIYMAWLETEYLTEGNES